MLSSKGFSLIEIIVSLLLISGTSIALIKQQWQLSQTVNQSLLESNRLNALANQRERNE